MRIGVIGSGPAGVSASLELAKRGHKVTLVEKEDRLGGTCVLYGCIPSKAMLNPIHLLTSMEKVGKRDVSFSLDELKKLGKEASSRISKGVEYLLEDNGVEVVHGNASLRSGVLNVNNESLNPDYIIIATGTYRERTRGIIYSEDLPYLDRDFNSVILVGGDVGGIEFGWLLRKIGKEVFLIDKQNSLLPYLDKDISNTITNYFSRIGVKLYLGRIVKEMKENEVILDNGERLTADVVYMTFGRKPSIDGFEEIKHNPFIQVDEYLRTSLSNVFAAGDIIGTHTAHEASYAGKIAALNIVGERKVFNTLGIPKVVYTHPTIAYVGRMEGQCVKFSLSNLGRAIVEKETDGILKICVENDRIVGAQAFMKDAEEVISLISLMIRFNMSVNELKDFVAPHPSYIEAITEVLSRI
ncbi:pyridine nucleotide-disulfide oxidoreductase [Sulfolobus sp. A20]|uniref:dihydrolipoyl dehydrogenase family protein n=1 Tax=Sulfolobaceae TaxID=118883 RepID=UPI000845F68C|nr:MULTISPECIES: NAD(P)/FAD-dependent oxidoreductase [unclassified Sulfolobus]TRM74150.1 NAD(P)/FAD-dependent oxidoreductase [Sulfolobus sp. B5]TRM78704.1 NAD(P)/FAD-dependent oxidoreductase [Sulfolobus sp. A20-N-F8]TRM81795.1 NAD(P)/FAD-dependent oxidoreductase [Sulfolobus sp. D5]TRM87889.1 NAD(P)/FAD-dependent oxidoreductase [Sulfolobus sp. C3]TRM95555.1 NAD(P)/FAD-dependent oxidoreductase [Sulfolobus sp. A20-N-G8]TRM98573.1 NAD(P)/FAD-dependent oxidoreductase [Sulfolobus sp. E1]TRN02604.1